MGWARFDDGYSDHPKIAEAGHLAELLDMRAIIYCARYETDGHLTAAQLAKLSSGIPAVQKRVDSLVNVGRWTLDQSGNGWWIHDFLDYNPSRADREAERAEARERMRRVRANKPRTSGEQAQGVRANFGRSSEEVRSTPTRPPVLSEQTRARKRDAEPPAPRPPDYEPTPVVGKPPPPSIAAEIRGKLGRVDVDEEQGAA